MLSDIEEVEPSLITYRSPNVPSLYIDSRLGKLPTSDASNVIIASNIANYSHSPHVLINGVRRLAVKNVNLFMYLDNITTGFNDVVTFGVKYESIPLLQSFSLTIPQGVYSVQTLATTLQTLLDAHYTATWGSVPLPVVTVTYIAPVIGDESSGLYGSIEIGITYGIMPVLVSIDPLCSFALNSPSMLVLSLNNTYPVPTVEKCRFSFFSLCPYNYIDIVSNDLTKDASITNKNNSLYNYSGIIYRMHNPKYGFNSYEITEPLNWINTAIDCNLTRLDFSFYGNGDQLVRGAITRNFWWTMQISLQR